MIGEALSVLTALLGAVSAILAAKALKEIDPLNANVLRVLFSSISMLPIAFIVGEIHMSNLDFYGLLFVTLAAIIGFGAGDVCLLKSMELIGVSRSYIIAYTFPMITMVLATLFLGDPFLLRHLIGTVTIFFGIVLVSIENSKGMKESSKGRLYAFATAILWSVGAILVAHGLTRINVILANTFRMPVVLAFLLAIGRPWKKKLKLNKENLALLAGSGILGLTIGANLFLSGVQLIGISRATALSSSSPVWAAIMSNIFLKERITWKVIASSLMVVAGTYFLT